VESPQPFGFLVPSHFPSQIVPSLLLLLLKV